MFLNIRITFVLLLMTWNVFSQADTTRLQSGGFVSFHYGALFSSIQAPSITLSVVSGIRYDRLTLHVGAGYDTYEGWNLAPVFAGAGWDIIKYRRHAIALRADAGFSKAWNTFSENEWITIDDHGGHFFHPMVDFRMTQGKITLHFSAGYKFQRVMHKQPMAWSWGWRQAPVVTVVRDMERLTIQMGIGLN